MSTSGLFKKYIWLVDVIYSSSVITREEIDRRWSRSSLNEDHENGIPERTFHRYKDAIKDLFDIDIVCDRSAGKVYRISNTDEIERGGSRTWLLNTFAVNNLINESHHLKHRILFEEIPSGQKYLSPIIQAMRDGKTVNISYQSFYHPHPYTFEVEPYCGKVFKQRWYLLARNIGEGSLKIYALDRLHGLEQTGNSFELPKGFDAEGVFHDVIGIIIGGREQLEVVEIKVTDGQQNYFRSLPLHHSQKEIVKDDDYSIFSYYLRPTFDFRQELLKYGDAVEVIKPMTLRREMAKISKAMSELYAE